MNVLFDPSNPGNVKALALADLGALPGQEDGLFEFKSSLTPDDQLAFKIERAASGFWNGGGGFLVVGVDGNGAADGGVSAHVGRQTRRDWADQAVHRVTPTGPYEIQFLEGVPARGTLESQRGVLVIAFGDSSSGPHMASDSRYYLRAGAHTAPASHFIVEAIRARRGLSAPLITFLLKRKDDSSFRSEMELINLSPVPAIDLTVTIIPPPSLLLNRGTPGEVRIRVLDTLHPALIPFSHVAPGSDWVRADEPHRMLLEYRDTLGREYREEKSFLPRHDLPKPRGEMVPVEQIAIALNRIASQLEQRPSGQLNR
jgi:hypothetical protein